MQNTFIISDTHFHHNNIIRYCDRPFADADEMDEKLIENWNAVVKPQDKIYHLGDVYFPSKKKNTEHSVLSRLNGTKILIVGNHDTVKDPLLDKYFSRIYMWRYLKEHNLLLTHVPVHPGSIIGGEATMNVHGHIHDQPSPIDGKYFNACVEWTNYAPIALEDVKYHNEGYTK
jgi:calcineurin-like phosphoesterase family protein